MCAMRKDSSCEESYLFSVSSLLGNQNVDESREKDVPIAFEFRINTKGWGLL